MSTENKVVKYTFSIGFSLTLLCAAAGIILSYLAPSFAQFWITLSVAVIIALPIVMLFILVLVYIKQKNYLFAFAAAAILLAVSIEVITGASQ